MGVGEIIHQTYNYIAVKGGVQMGVVHPDYIVTDENGSGVESIWPRGIALALSSWMFFFGGPKEIERRMCPYIYRLYISLQI